APPRRGPGPAGGREAAAGHAGRGGGEVRTQLAADVCGLAEAGAELSHRAGELVPLRLDLEPDPVGGPSVSRGHRSSTPPLSSGPPRAPAPGRAELPCGSDRGRAGRAAPRVLRARRP